MNSFFRTLAVVACVFLVTRCAERVLAPRPEPFPFPMMIIPPPDGLPEAEAPVERMPAIAILR